ncbi:unnamed protein product [Rotaria magnacalcarata]
MLISQVSSFADLDIEDTVTEVEFDCIVYDGTIIVVKLSEQDSLLQEILTAERINSQGIQYCPQCHVPIEKNGGCLHMHCARCNNDFTWRIIQEPTASIITPYLENEDNMEIESFKEEFNKAASLVENPVQENLQILSDQTGNNNQQINDEDLKISIDNRSTIGSIILNRVKVCPSKSCKKTNVKMKEDNWMICSTCMKQYCFLCGAGVNGQKHFANKCIRNTPI